MHLLRDCDVIISELEHHQVCRDIFEKFVQFINFLFKQQNPNLPQKKLQIELGQIKSSTSLIGSFQDDVTKWQKTLQNIEVVVKMWVKVQHKWVKLDDIYSSKL